MSRKPVCPDCNDTGFASDSAAGPVPCTNLRHGSRMTVERIVGEGVGELVVEDWRTFGLRMSDTCDELTKMVERLRNAAIGLQNDVERLQQQRAEQMLRIAQLKAVTALAFSHLASVLDDEDCRFDHEGYCQTHSISKPCEVAVAREFLRTHPHDSDPC